MNGKQQTIDTSTPSVTNQPPTHPIINQSSVPPIANSQQPIDSNSQSTLNPQETPSSIEKKVRTGANLLLMIPGVLLIIGGSFLSLIAFIFAGDSGKIVPGAGLASLLIGAIPAAFGIALIALGYKIQTKSKGAKILGVILLIILGLVPIVNGIIGVSKQHARCEEALQIKTVVLRQYEEENNKHIDKYCNTTPTGSIVAIAIGTTLIGIALLLLFIRKSKK